MTSIFNKDSPPQIFNDLGGFQEDKSVNFLEALKTITNNLKDGYKQVTIKQFTAKTEKAPPPADLFANLP